MPYHHSICGGPHDALRVIHISRGSVHGRHGGGDLQGPLGPKAEGQARHHHGPVLRRLPGGDAPHRVLPRPSVQRVYRRLRPLDRLRPPGADRRQHDQGVLRKGRGVRLLLLPQGHAPHGGGHQHRRPGCGSDLRLPKRQHHSRRVLHRGHHLRPVGGGGVYRPSLRSQVQVQGRAGRRYRADPHGV